MGPTRSPRRPPSLAPTARRHADGMSLLYTVLYMGPLAPSAGQDYRCSFNIKTEFILMKGIASCAATAMNGSAVILRAMASSGKCSACHTIRPMNEPSSMMSRQLN